VFTDYLSVTFSPLSNPSDELLSFLCNCGYEVDDMGGSSTTKFTFPADPLRGKISIKIQSNFVLVSCTGKAIQYLQKLSQWNNLLSIFSNHPHSVTRLDAAMDVPRDFVSVLRGINRKYPNHRFSFGRKIRKITETLAPRDSDNQLSGTCYFGKRRDEVNACIYDKSLELMEKFKVEIPTTTRYELRFRATVGITLKDASEPSSLFWHYGHHLLLKKPSGVSEWVSGGEYIGWEHKIDKPLPYEQMVNSIQYSKSIDSWLILAQGVGKDGGKILKKLVTERIDVEFARLMAAQENLEQS